MKDYDANKAPRLDDESEENFARINDFIDELYEKAKKEKKAK